MSNTNSPIQAYKTVVLIDLIILDFKLIYNKLTQIFVKPNTVQTIAILWKILTIQIVIKSRELGIWLYNNSVSPLKKFKTLIFFSLKLSYLGN